LSTFTHNIYSVCCNCRNGSQTLMHLFVECDFSRVFWIEFTFWWNSKNNMQINLQQRDILFALHPEKKSFLGINYCLLVAKQCIYTSNAKNEDPFCFTAFLKFLKNKLGINKRRFETLLLFRALFSCLILVCVYNCCNS